MSDRKSIVEAFEECLTAARKSKELSLELLDLYIQLLVAKARLLSFQISLWWRLSKWFSINELDKALKVVKDYRADEKES